MRLKSLSLTNFRNYDAASVRFHRDVNLIIGGNSQGKTNLLEAIGYLSVPKSHRATRDHELIKIGKDFFRIVAQVESERYGQSVVTIVYTGREKNIQVDGEPLNSVSDLVGYVKSVSLFPESAPLTWGPPNIRRRFINLLLSQIDRDYLHSLQGYNRVLSHRNRLLSTGKASEVKPWDEQLVRLGSRLMVKRKEAVEAISGDFERFYKLIADTVERAEVDYIPSVRFDHPGEAEENYREQLERNRRNHVYRM